MSVSQDLHVVLPPGAGCPRYVSDMIAAFYFTLTLSSVRPHRKFRVFLSLMITVARRCAAALGKPPEKVTLVSVFAGKKKLIRHFNKLKINRNYKVQHKSCADHMLRYAHELGWTSAAYERLLKCRRAWEPIRAALTGDTEGCLSLVDQAEKELKEPGEIDETFVIRWRKSRSDRLPGTVREEEGRFRTRMRKAGLESRFPLLDLRNRLPSEFAISEMTAPRTLIDDIETAVHFKVDEIVAGRPASGRVKPRTGDGIRTALREVCGIAIDQFEGITRLKHVFTEEVFDAVIRYLRDDRELPGAGIRSRLGSLSFITRTDLVEEGKDYSWFRRNLRNLDHEARWRLDERQSAKCISYEELARVSRKIRAYRKRTRNLSKVEIAWRLHDELLTRWPLHLPWRFCSIADCGLFPPAFINIIYVELPLAMRADPDLPGWVKRALRRNRHQKFLQFNFGRSQCKNNHQVRDIVPLELASLYWEYREYRGSIVDPDNDDGTLFLNRKGRRLSSVTCRRRFADLVEDWIGLKARPHLTRDSYCEYRLAHGDSMRQLQRKLWHRYLISTERYCRRYGAAHGAAVLDRRLATPQLHRKAA